MSRLQNLYTYLVEHRRAELEDWRHGYEALYHAVSIVATALRGGGTLPDPATYVGSEFEGANSGDPWPEFARRLLYDKSNGVASRGQSVLSWENFEHFLGTPDFVAALAAMIQTPDKPRFQDLEKAWGRALLPGSKGSPLLIRRTLAACTSNVSSTVHEADFNQVYSWLEREGLIERPSAPPADWFDRNVHLMECLRRAFAGEPPEQRPSDVLLSIFVWQLVENLSNPFTLKKQVIKYGAPGTGKTFTAEQETRLLFRIWEEKAGAHGPQPAYAACAEKVQFHPSYGYEDFIEGLRPVPDGNGGVALRLCNGIFKEFCRRAGAWEIDVHGIPEVGPERARDWERLTVGDLRPHFDSHLSGDRWVSIRAMPDAARVTDGVPPFFFLIDEINRAELSRVLGELMLCLEYRGVRGAISTQYAALAKQEDAMLMDGGRPRFFIPHNVYLTGTMNTIDRSVESFDLALRRRFRWERIDPDMALLRLHLGKRDAEPGNGGRPWVGLADNLEKLNGSIRAAEGLGRDYEIGHAYLMDMRYPPTLTAGEVRKHVWADALNPLLEEYLRGSGRGDELIPEFAKAFGVT